MQENTNEQTAKAATESAIGAGGGIYRTPQAAIDAVLANPPFGEASPEPAREDRHLSNGDAIAILARIAAERTRTVEEVTALEMGANRMLKKFMQKQRNWARRREREAAEKTDTAKDE